MVFKCSILRMESFSILCERISVVLVYIDINKLPKSLLLNRWMKNAKVAVHNANGFMWDSLVNCQYTFLMKW